MPIAEQLFKLTLHIAKFCNTNVLEIRKVQFKEIVYIYNSLVSYDFEDVKEQYRQPVQKGRKLYADQVDWFN